MRRRTVQSSVLVALALALACGAGGSATASAAGWLPAAPPATAANGPSRAVVAVGPAGDAVAVWTDDDGSGTQSLLVATRPAGGPWSTPQTIPTPLYVDAPAATIDAAGNATVVWIEAADASPGNVRYARAARHDALSGAWSPPHYLSPDPQSPSGSALPQTQVRADAAGNAIAAWVEESGAGRRRRSPSSGR